MEAVQDEDDTARTAAEFDAAVVRSYVDWRSLGEIGWEALGVQGPAAGPFAALGSIRLTVSPTGGHPRRWNAEADPEHGPWMYTDPGGDKSWPDAESAKRALEAVVFGAPEAKAVEVTQGGRPSEPWDWDTGEWAAAG